MNFELDRVARMSLSDQEEEIGETATEDNRVALKLAVLDIFNEGWHPNVISVGVEDDFFFFGS